MFLSRASSPLFLPFVSPHRFSRGRPPHPTPSLSLQVDGFRFDLMGHLMKDTMVRTAYWGGWRERWKGDPTSGGTAVLPRFHHVLHVLPKRGPHADPGNTGDTGDTGNTGNTGNNAFILIFTTRQSC